MTDYTLTSAHPPEPPRPPRVDFAGVVVWCFLAFAGGALFAAMWTL